MKGKKFNIKQKIYKKKIIIDNLKCVKKLIFI